MIVTALRNLLFKKRHFDAYDTQYMPTLLCYTSGFFLSVECLLYNYHTLLQPLFLQCKKNQNNGSTEEGLHCCVIAQSMCKKC